MLKYRVNNNDLILSFDINHQISGEYQSRVGLLKKDNAAHILLNRISKDSMVIKSYDNYTSPSELISCDGNRLIVKTMCLDEQDRKIVINRLIKKIQRFFHETSRKKIS